jgi:hypothetical protein
LVGKVIGDTSVEKSNTVPFPNSNARQVTKLNYEYVLRFSTFDFRGFYPANPAFKRGPGLPAGPEPGMIQGRQSEPLV